MAGTRILLLALGAATLTLAACDNGPSAVAKKQAAGTQVAEAADDAASATPSRTEASGVDHRDDPVKLVDGKPMWSASRRYSAEENARRAFARNGPAFNAGTIDAFVEKAHAFVERPPRGTLTL